MANTNGLWRRIRGAVTAVAAVALVAVPTLAQAAGDTVALVATQKAGDKGPIDGLIDGLKQAESAYGVKTSFIEATDPSTFENTLRTLARRGTNVVITTFYEMGSVVQQVAPDFPNTKFVVIVAAPLNPELPNARVVGYATQQNAYLAGTFAASMSKTGKIALIGGVPLPYVWADYNALTNAAKAVNPAIQTQAAFVQSFEDPVKGREVAAGLFAQGVDGIYTGAAASDVGVVEAAANTNNLVIAASPPLVDQAPASVGMIASFEWSKTIMIELKNALGEFKSGFRLGGIDSGEIVMSFSDAYAKSNPAAAAARAATQAVYDKIAAGTLTVPYDATEPK